jgi:hypothetical protein
LDEHVARDTGLHEERHGVPSVLWEAIDEAISKTSFDSPLGVMVSILVVILLALCAVGLVHGLVTSMVDQLVR